MPANTNLPQKDLIQSTNAFSVVGIGASAGGLDAFKRFTKAIPADSGMAYVMVQHLDPTHDSILPELLQKVTKIPVLEISDNVRVEPNHIYIIPSNKMLIANDGVLELSPRADKSVSRKNMPIDLFFSSLAEIHGAHAIGVVLSGNATDGTLGLKAIKDEGGITFAQTIESADFAGMPRSAIQAGVVDFDLTPEEIPSKIIEIANILNHTGNDLLEQPDNEDDIYNQTIALLRIRKGTDFTFYKQPTIRRRILRRIALTNKSTSSKYLQYLRENKMEQDILYQDLLIPVTEFFRDPKIFDNLCRKVFPEILKNKIPEKPIRIWLAGCSTGQEAYSVAICLSEFLGGKLNKVQIFATDISEPAIAKARAGVYSSAEVSGLSPHRLSEYFTQKNGSYMVNRPVRDMCVFAIHNFLKDPPFGNIDFVACRNVLIYMEPYLQKKALITFHYALNAKGFLLLGKSESIGAVPELFAAEIQNDKLFIRKNAASRFMHVPTARSQQNFYDQGSGAEISGGTVDFQKTVDNVLMNNYTPAGVVVNEALDIVQFRGATGPYLEQTSGKPSHNLLKLARTGLAFELRSILMKAKKENKAIIKENIPIGDDGNETLVTLEALRLPDIIEPHFLVLFQEVKKSATGNPKQSQAKQSAANLAYKDSRIKQLESELLQLREDMRSVTEDQEAANEELQSANEELLSGSEELQSLNEELETGKEELQSTNEELTVMNQEMLSLNVVLTNTIDYTDTIIATIREPLLVLDARLHVKSVNKAFNSFFGDLDESSGLSVFEIGGGVWNIPALKKLFLELLPQRKKVSNYEVTFSLPMIGERIMLLNIREMSPKSGEKLTLVVLEDVTQRIQILQKETALLKRFQNLVMHSPVAVCILKGSEYTVELANDFYLKLMDKGPDFIGSSIFKTMPELEKMGVKKILDEVMNTGGIHFGNEVETEITRNQVKEKAYFDFVYQPMFETDKSISGIIIVATNITDQIVARKKAEAQAALIYNLLMTAPGFVCTMEGPEHIFRIVNKQYQQLFGTREIKNKPILAALPELEGQGFDVLLDEVYTTGKPYVGIEVPITLACDVNMEPEERYFNFSYQPMYDENETIHSILVFGYEITEEVNAKNKIDAIQLQHSLELEANIKERTSELLIANKRLLEKNEKLLKMNKELESFNYISSHDLQEPLRKIQLFSSRILQNADGNLSSAHKDDFIRIQASAWRMQTLIQDLLSYSQASILEQSYTKMDLILIIEQAKDDLSETIAETNATIEIGNLCDVNVDPSQFRQVMNNLIGNALKFVKPGVSPHIVIKSNSGTGKALGVKALHADKTYCHISICDNGIGIDPQYKDRIFEVFQRLHHKDIYSGTGIGLAIVKKIIENHNGIITLDSEVDKGCTFNIYVPSY